jgi:hypothetical protein
MAVSGRPPHELAGAAHALMIFQRAFEHIGLLQRGVLVQRHDGARIELEQSRRDAALFGLKHFDPDARKPRLLPRHVGDVEIT